MQDVTWNVVVGSERRMVRPPRLRQAIATASALGADTETVLRSSGIHRR